MLESWLLSIQTFSTFLKNQCDVIVTGCELVFILHVSSGIGQYIMCLFRVWTEELSSTKQVDWIFHLASKPHKYPPSSNRQALLRLLPVSDLDTHRQIDLVVHSGPPQKSTVLGHWHGCHDAFKCNKPRDQYWNVHKAPRSRKSVIFFFRWSFERFICLILIFLSLLLSISHY